MSVMSNLAIDPEPTTRKLTDTDTANFRTLQLAFENDDVCIMDCFDTLTGRSEVLLCATMRDGQGNVQFAPFALMLNVHEVAYDRIRPAGEDGGYAPVSGCEATG